ARHPDLAAPAPVCRHSVIYPAGDPHPRPPHLDQARALRVDVHAKLDLQRAKLVWLAPVRSRFHGCGCAHRPLSLRISALISKKIYSGTNMSRRVSGSTPGVRKLATRARPTNHQMRFL